MNKIISVFVALVLLTASIMTASADEFGTPEYYNSVEKGYVTSVKDQGKAATCWAFSAISALETDAIVKGYETKETADFSEAHLTSFIFLFLKMFFMVVLLFGILYLWEILFPVYTKQTSSKFKKFEVF